MNVSDFNLKLAVCWNRCSRINFLMFFSLTVSEPTQVLAEKMEKKRKKKKKKKRSSKKKTKKVKKVGEDDQEEVLRVDKQEEFGGRFSRMVSNIFTATY